MSITSELERITTAKGNLTTALNQKGANIGAETLDQFADEVLSFPQKAETYCYPEAFEVARKIQAVKALNPTHRFVTFGCITDSHVNFGGTYEEQGKASIKSGVFALQTIGNMVNADFLVNLGDNCSGNRFDGVDNINNLKAQEYLRDVSTSAHNSREMFHLVGNHDRSQNTLDVYNMIGALNNFDTPTSASASLYTKERSYGYKDFDNYKLRVICLNTTDYWNVVGGNGMSYEQKKLFAEFLDLSNKANASEWKILILSHIPLDFNTNAGNETDGDYNKRTDLKKILDAYVSGGSATINIKSGYNVTDKVNSDFTINYAGKNQAKIICNIHGHVHLIRDQVNPDNDIVQICTPNTCGIPDISKSSYYGYTSFNGTAYEKTQNTAQDTSCTWYVIDLDGNKIYSYIYGAGNTVDRTINYSTATRYKITNTLVNCSTTNTRTSIYSGSSFSETIEADTDYTLDGAEIIITMGGTDITSTAFSNGIINISNVTGDIVITATAVSAISYTNLLDGLSVKDNCRFNSSGAVATNGTCNYWCVEDYIPCTPSDTIRAYLPNNTPLSGSTMLFVAYNSNKEFINSYYANNTSGIISIDSDGLGWSFTAGSFSALQSMAYIRICGTPPGSHTGDEVLTKNEVIR